MVLYILFRLHHDEYAFEHCQRSHSIFLRVMSCAYYTIFPNTRFAHLPTFTRTPEGSFLSLSEVKAEVRRNPYFLLFPSYIFLILVATVRPAHNRAVCQRSNSAVSRRTPRIIAKPLRWNQARRFGSGFNCRYLTRHEKSRRMNTRLARGSSTFSMNHLSRA